ncbi:hypothetical protein LK07_16510 [Streptomyces pluripotens]|uniref:Gram-positive cocci surface proteins LPxTG domain-containing protein n=1 Tax=Streptomyces pluripotens TaxID=1355015 RepID=A0A221NZP5_9ACTN|nr:hypothetical protein [Streptomyces pluripotens]ARP71116.1 hypothetical protein LK06_015375 [Streptomyces pluripotens]ASN25364.1 hypothetical protein LK07_16510 [Streptomyces pluripotens]
MTPWLRLTLRCVRLLFVLTTALPACSAVTLCGTASAYAAEPDSARSSAAGHPNRQSHPEHQSANRPGRGHPNPAVTGHGTEDARRSDAPIGEPVGGQDSESAGNHGRTQGQGHGEIPARTPVGVQDHTPDRAHRGSPAAGTWAAHAPALSVSASTSPSTKPSRAGSLAGEGRMRPGRADATAGEVEGAEDSVPTRAQGTDGAPSGEPETADAPGGTPEASEAIEGAGLDPADPAPQPAARQAVQEGGGPTEPVLQTLPLGSGLVLIGLGLGLALLGIRLRKT